MILLAMLVGAALFAALYVWLGNTGAIVVAALFMALVALATGIEIGRSIHDRRVAYRRWRRWGRR